jgi:ribosomal-protein-alanine N-acetyltransferase
VLETPRLLLRPLRHGDAEALFAVYSDGETVRYYDMLPHQSLEETAALIRRNLERFENQQAIRWAITRKGEDVALGTCGFHGFDETSQRAEMGYILNKAYWRQGIMSAALEAILAFGFGSAALHRIEATVTDNNYRSKAILTKLGFAYEGCRRERFFFDNRFWDEHHFGLLREEYARNT